MTTEVTVKMYECDQTTKALYVLYDLFRRTEEDRALRAIAPEPISFARYIIAHPEKWEEAQEIAEQMDRARKEHLANQPPKEGPA